MSKKQTQKHAELSWEEAVAKYLEDHPDFFQQHAGLLRHLQVPHLETGHAVSLIEKQVSVLRDRNHTLQQQLQDLVQIARENETLGERVHRFSLSLGDCGDLDDALDTAQDVLREEFKLDASVLLIKRRGKDTAGRPEFVTASDKRLAALLKRIGATKTLCDNKLDRGLRDYLSGGRSPPIESAALIPIGGNAPWGVLILGSREPDRFQPDMGTVYLIRLGEVLTRALQRFLAP